MEGSTARPGASAPSRPGRWAPAGLLAASLGLAALLYGASLDAPFQWDDYGSIEVNAAIRSPARVLEVYRLADLLGPARPVTALSLALDVAAADLSPRAVHLTSLLLHLLTALALFALLRGLLDRAGHPRAAALAAAVAGSWALHPLATETVAYGAQRSEVLASLLALAALALMLRSGSARSRQALVGWSLAAAAVLALATGAKVIAVMVPAVFTWRTLALPDQATAPGRAPWMRTLQASGPSWLVAAASVVRVLWLVRPEDGAGLAAAAGIGPWRYLLTQLRVHWLYARLVAWPAGQSIEHGVTPSPGLADLVTDLALLALAGVVWGAVWAWRRAPSGAAGSGARVAVFGLGWWLLFLLPTSSIIPIDDLAAEHRTYLASAGLLLAAVTALDAALARRSSPRRRAAVGMGLLLLAWSGLGAALSERLTAWGSEATLWGDAWAGNPASSRAANNFGFGLQRSGDLAGADATYAAAQALARTPADLANALRNRAAVANLRGRPAEALAHLDLGLAASPDDFELLAIRADALLALGRTEEAVAEATRAVGRAPGLSGPRETLGMALLRAGRAEEALAQFQAMSSIDPVHPRARELQVVALITLRREGEACARWRSLGGSARASAEVPEARRLAGWIGCERR